MTTIYVIGDSFSAGAELEDHTFESYKKVNPKNGDEYHSKWISSKEYQDELNSRVGYHKADAELKRAWPAKLESITNARVINKSFGGSGPAMWRASTLMDFLDFNKTNTTIDVAIIQVTDYNRSCLFTINEHNSITYCNIAVHSLTYGTNFQKLFLKSKIMLQDDIGDFFNFLVDLATIKLIFLNNGVKTIKFVGSYPFKFNNNYSTYVTEIAELLNFLEIDFENMLYMMRPNENLPGGHCNESTHEKFALEMKKILNL
jgi:hypothetical protein